jgi:hypothetical protein
VDEPDARFAGSRRARSRAVRREAAGTRCLDIDVSRKLLREQGAEFVNAWHLIEGS